MEDRKADLVGLLLKGNVQARLLLFAVVPAVLVLVQSSPGLRDVLVLRPAQPTFAAVFFSAYAHTSFAHMLGNVANYLFVMGLVFVFGAYANRRALYSIIALIFIAVPPVTSLLAVWLTPGLARMEGFSAVVAALFGCLIFSLILFIRRFYGLHVGENLAYLFLLFNFLSLSFIYGYPSASAVFLALMVVAISLRGTRAQLRGLLGLFSTRHIQRDPLAVFLVFMALASVLSSAVIFFPRVFITGGSLTNILAHYAGYVLGFSIAQSVYSSAGVWK